MKITKHVALAFLAIVGVIVAGSIAVADPSKQSDPAGQPQMQLPPGWTMEDVQACMVAATPGKMHEHLAQNIGEWQGRNTAWMYPGAEPVKSESTVKISPMLDGRYIRCEMSGDWPGMGPYNGFALYGFDNVAQQFVATWIDNCGTGMAIGTGALSADGKTLTWNFTFNCPLTGKPAPLREVQTTTGPHSKTVEVFANDPKSGKEFKMMQIELTRKPGTEKTAAAGSR
jgi:hypothetical protein